MLVPYARKNHNVSNFNPFHDFDELERAFFSDNALGEFKKNKYVRCERSYGTYARSFDISGIDAAGIKAAYADGVLRVTLPKQKEVPASSRRLEIE